MLIIVGDLSERALREIYLKPFQIAVKNSNPWALMTSFVFSLFLLIKMSWILNSSNVHLRYNRVNGLHVSENSWLIDDILRKVRRHCVQFLSTVKN